MTLDEYLAGTGQIGRSLIGQGLGMGYGDEAEAWLRSKMGDKPYDEELANVQKSMEGFAERNPVTAMTSELAGGLIPLAASYFVPGAQEMAPVTTASTLNTLRTILSNPITRGALVGATTGGISGYGHGKPGDRLSDAGVGAGLGLFFGAAAPVIMRGAGAGYNWLRDRLLPTEEAITRQATAKVNRALGTANAGQGMTAEEMAQKVAADRAQGIPSTAANADQALVDLAETVAQRSGTSARKIEDTLERQTAGSRERTYARTKEALGGGNFYEEESSMVDSLRRNAKNMYDEAYALGPVEDLRIMSVLKNPRFKGFYDKAREIAEAEKLAAKLRGEDTTKFDLTELYQLDKKGNIVSVKIPDVRTLDYIKRGIDATVESAYRTGGMSTAEANALKELRKVYVSAIDEATINPQTGISPYAAARKAYAGDMEVIDALRLGRDDFNKLDHEEILAMMGKMSTAEKEAFRTGVIRNTYDQIMKPSGNMNAAQRLVGSPENVAKFQTLFDSPAQFQLFKAALEREAQLFKQTGRILGGSATGRRTAQREAFNEGVPVGDVVANTITGGFGSSLLSLAARAARSTTMTDDVAEKVAKLLMSSEPAEVAAAVKLLEDYSKKAATSSTNQLAREAGVIGGITNVMQPDIRTDKPVVPLAEVIAQQPAPSSGLSQIEADIAASKKAP
jgi:hypothetical protein